MSVGCCLRVLGACVCDVMCAVRRKAGPVRVGEFSQPGRVGGVARVKAVEQCPAVVLRPPLPSTVTTVVSGRVERTQRDQHRRNAAKGGGRNGWPHGQRPVNTGFSRRAVDTAVQWGLCQLQKTRPLPPHSRSNHLRGNVEEKVRIVSGRTGGARCCCPTLSSTLLPISALSLLCLLHLLCLLSFRTFAEHDRIALAGVHLRHLEPQGPGRSRGGRRHVPTAAHVVAGAKGCGRIEAQGVGASQRHAGRGGGWEGACGMGGEGRARSLYLSRVEILRGVCRLALWLPCGCVV